MSSESELATARSERDTSSKDVETAREITESVRIGLRGDDPSEDVKTARSPGEKSSKDAIRTARELAEKSVHQFAELQPTDLVTANSAASLHSSSCNTAGLNRDLDAMVNTAQTFLLPVGTLPADGQRSLTEVHDSQQKLAQTPHTFDARAALSARNLGDAPNKAHLASVDGDVKTARESPSNADLSTAQCCDTPTKDVKTAVEPSASLCNLATALSECDTSSKDVETAKEITDAVRQLLASSSSSYEDMSTAQSFVLPVGTLPADGQRSLTEVHGSQQKLAQTPQTFDARAALSARNLGDAPNKAHLASVDGDVKTAREESSSTDLKTARCYDTPLKVVRTACSPGEKSLTTAHEFNESMHTGSQPNEIVLHLDGRRSVTEIHGSQAQLAHTPQTFDARAALSARNLGDAPNKAHLASVEGDVKTAREESSSTNLKTALCCDTPTKDVKTAVEPSASLYEQSTLATALSESDISSKDVQTAREITDDIRSGLLDTPTKDVATARSPGEKSLKSLVAPNQQHSFVSTASEITSSNISSLSRYHSFENVHPELPPRHEGDEEDILPPTPEQLLAEDRKKRDPSSYYYEPSLNKGPVDRAPRLRAVSSKYAVNELSNYAMDEPDQRYKLKTNTLLSPRPAPCQLEPSTSNDSALGLRCVPSEYALDTPEHAYNHKSAIYHHNPLGRHH